MAEEEKSDSGGGSSSPNPVYIVALLVGVGLAIYIYAIKFDDLSESRLTQLSPLWVLAIVFGVVGLLAEKGARLVRAGEAEDMNEGMAKAAEASPLAYFICYRLPALIFSPAKTSGNPMVIAAIVTAFWAVLLYLFFLVIFPSL